jgi:uncharacterized membrane protein
MRPDEVFVVVFMIFILGLLGLMFYSLLLRYRRRELQHKERLAALEKGVPLPELHEERRAPWSPQLYLLRGMIWLFSGIAIMLCLGAVAHATQEGRVANLEERLDRAKQLRALGASEEQIKESEREVPSRDGMPYGLALLGLIPSGVGVAYLMFYRAQGKNSGVPLRQDP